MLNLQRTWKLWFLILLLVVVILTALSCDTAKADSIYPSNPDEAAAMIGDGDGSRSGNPQEWDSNCDEDCLHLKKGDLTKIHLTDCMWANVYYDGASHQVWGPWDGMVEEATVYRDWSCEVTPEPTREPDPTPNPTPDLTPTPFPEIPANPPLERWPETPEEAAEKFSPQGMQQIAASEVSACNNGAGDCWKFKFPMVRPIYITKGGSGQIGPDEFITEDGRWVLEITIWADWENLPSEPDPTPDPTPEPDPTLDPLPTPDPTPEPTPIPQNPQLRGFPQTAEKAAEAFGVPGERSAQVDQWSQCDNWQPDNYVLCWFMMDGDGTPFSLPLGANSEFWDGTTFYKVGPWTGIVGRATVRPEWKDIDEVRLYLPTLIRN